MAWPKKKEVAQKEVNRFKRGKVMDEKVAIRHAEQARAVVARREARAAERLAERQAIADSKARVKRENAARARKRNG